MVATATVPFISHLRSYPPPSSCVSPSFPVTVHIFNLPHSLRQQSVLTRCSYSGRMGWVNKEKKWHECNLPKKTSFSLRTQTCKHASRCSNLTIMTITINVIYVCHLLDSGALYIVTYFTVTKEMFSVKKHYNVRINCLNQDVIWQKLRWHKAVKVTVWWAMKHCLLN